ncbi:hypothetical protein T4A_12929 [Trichinella pseudospiralis]|uniref:Uncharacterized protein n=1 Tax=Trichinella pseudospiralis TaxID=6337 RepID=A0A0V1EIS9_TRIPS|nr:hypothetical protein T4A_12929 [Trichinella pseudospiralis]
MKMRLELYNDIIGMKMRLDIAWRSNVGRALRLPDEFAVRLHSSRRGALKFHQGVCQVTVGIVALSII